MLVQDEYLVTCRSWQADLSFSQSRAVFDVPVLALASSAQSQEILPQKVPLLPLTPALLNHTVDNHPSAMGKVLLPPLVAVLLQQH